MQNKIFRWILIAVACLALAVNATQASAQIQNQWQPDARIPGYQDSTLAPYMVVDKNRTVHAFASQIVDPEALEKVIIYRQWSLTGGWSKANDILISPIGDALIQGAFLDNHGIVHVIFWSGSADSSHIFYSKSPVQTAGSGFSWTSPVIIGNLAVETTSASIVGDDDGNLLVIYNGRSRGNGVYEIHSTDGGDTWSKSTPVFLTYDSSLLPFSLRLALGQGGRIHAAWNVVTILGEDRSLHYANFDFSKEQWSAVRTLAVKPDQRGYFGPSYPSIVDTGKEVVIMYNGGMPFDGLPVPAGRPVQLVSVSKDNGDTWEVPVAPFYRHNGRSGEHTIVKDSDNNVHAIFIQRIEYVEENRNRVIGGIWHSVYKNGVWSVPERFIPSVQSSNIRAIVSQGNVLLATWIEDQGVGQSGVWYSYMLLDAPELPVVPFPTLSLPTVEAASPTANSPLDILPTLTPMAGILPPNVGGNPALPLVVGLLPVLALIGVFLYVYRQRIMKND